MASSLHAAFPPVDPSPESRQQPQGDSDSNALTRSLTRQMQQMESDGNSISTIANDLGLPLSEVQADLDVPTAPPSLPAAPIQLSLKA